MANCNILLKKFSQELNITPTKLSGLMDSKDSIREKVKNYFKDKHPSYKPKFWIQGSYKMKTMIRTKYDTCDLDDGVYFQSNPDNVSAETLQTWVENAVSNITQDVSHRKKCITINYKGDYSIDLPIYLFDEEKDEHPSLAIKENGFREDDPKEMVSAFKNKKNTNDQLLRIVRYLKAWCDYKREKMPSGLAMTILVMNNIQFNYRDDIALKYTLIEIQKVLKNKFECIVPATPFDDIFSDFTIERKNNFLSNLDDFVSDAKKAIDEKNQLKASNLWKKHLGDRFPDGDDKDETSDIDNIKKIATKSTPYARRW